jgi:uncharacterized protein (DUF983 family)
MLARAFARRCPVCGGHPIFNGWFRMAARCRRCQLTFRRERGSLTGELGLNTIASFAALLVTLIVFTLLTWPELPMGPALLTGLAVALLTPLLVYPWSRTLWLAIDLLLNPLRPGEVDAAVVRVPIVRGADQADQADQEADQGFDQVAGQLADGDGSSSATGRSAAARRRAER